MKRPVVEAEFIPVRLRDLDSVTGELLVISLFNDEKPPTGLAGLVDWRMDGLLSRTRLHPDPASNPNPLYHGMVLGSFPADFQEKLMFPVSHKLPFSNAIVVGMGEKNGFDTSAYRAMVSTIVDAASHLKANSMVLQLPGWQRAGIPARRAIEYFMESYLKRHQEGFTLPTRLCFVEHLEHQQEMAERIGEMLDPSGSKR